MAERFESIALSIRELADRLDIGKSSAHRLVLTGTIPGFRVGNSWRVMRSDFNAYIEAQRAAAEEFYVRARAS